MAEICGALVADFDGFYNGLFDGLGLFVLILLGRVILVFLF
jgi:hypothetical protein